MVMAKRSKKISTPFSVLAPPPGGAKNTLGGAKNFRRASQTRGQGGSRPPPLSGLKIHTFCVSSIRLFG